MAGRRPARGFTLVEVLVALFVMALLAALAWRGLDGVLRSRDISQAAVDRTMLLATLLTQWEQDLQSLQGDNAVPALAWDGRSLRLARRADGGVRMVAWSLNGSVWQRWTSPMVTRVAELQEVWLRSQQLQGSEPEQLRLLEGVGDFQVYCYRGNAWSNCQSSADLVAPVDGSASAPTTRSATELLPSGVRLVLQFDGKTLTRDIAIAPAS